MEDGRDNEAILAVRAGDRNAFRELVERYQAQAVGHARALVRQEADALDAVQEAFVDAFRALDRFDTGRRFYPWFYVLLRNRCLKLLARRRPTPSEEPERLLAPRKDEDAADLEALEGALAALDPGDRELITLKHLDGLTYAQLAERLDVPAGTVMSRLFHARRRLRALLSRHPSFEDTEA